MSNKNFLIKNGLSIGADNEVISSARAASFESATISGDLTVDTSTLKVDSSNNKVGIGTTSPATLLDIVGTDPNDNVNRVLNISDDRAMAADVGGSISFFGKYQGSSYSTYGQIIGGKTNATSGDYSGYMAFKTRSASALPAERVRIDSSGNIGIGTQAPAKRLHIRDDTQTNQSIRFGNETAAPYGEINYNSTGYEHLYIDSHGTTNGYGFTKMRNGPDLHESITINSDGYVTISRNASEYGLELRSTGTRSGLVLATPNSGNTIKGSLLLLADNTFRLGTQSVYNIHMNQSGHNTMPNQPYMRAYGNYGGMASSHGTTVDPWNHWAVGSSSGITHSSGVFTVPTTGKYLITYSFYLWINNSGQGVSHAVYLYVGNTNVQENMWEADLENDSYSYYDNTVSNSIIYNLTAGDTFKFVTHADTYGGTAHTNMSAYLLG